MKIDEIGFKKLIDSKYLLPVLVDPVSRKTSTQAIKSLESKSSMVKMVGDSESKMSI